MNLPCVLEKNETFSMEPSTGVKQVKLAENVHICHIAIFCVLVLSIMERGVLKFLSIM